MADNELDITITANADGVKEGVDQAKQHLDLAAESVSLLGDLIGVQVPDSIQKLAAGAAALGPALDAAFAPPQMVSFLQVLQEAQGKMTETVRETSQGWGDLSQAQKRVAELQQQINQEVEKESQLRREIAESHVQQNGQLKVAQGFWTEETAAQQTLARLQADRARALQDINDELAKQEAIVKRLAQETRDGTTGAPQQTAAYEQAVLAFEKMKAQQLEIEKKYDAQIAGQQLKLTDSFTDQLRKQMLQWRQVHQELGQVFQRTLGGMNQDLAAFITTGQANWKQLAASAIEEIIKIELQSIESQILMTLTHAQAAAEGDAIDQTTHAKEDTRSALSAAKGAWSWAANNNLLPLAPVFAASALAAVESFGSAEGGQYLVPGPQLTMLHAQEMVLPASLAARMRSVIDGGSGAGQPGRGVTVVVNHSVNAIDAQSFQETIRKNSNMIATEVGRALRKRGLNA